MSKVEKKATKSASVLELAQKLHDEHVAEGKKQAEALVSEAQEQHDQLLAEATERHDHLISEAEARAKSITDEAEEAAKALEAKTNFEVAETLEDLQLQKDELIEEIAKLREFEASYRTSLKLIVEDATKTLEVEE